MILTTSKYNEYRSAQNLMAQFFHISPEISADTEPLEGT